MKFDIAKFDNSNADVWNAFILDSKNGLFFFDRNYMDYHSDRFTDHSLIVLKKNIIVAVFPASEHGVEIISHGGLTYGSLVTSKNLKAVEVLQIFEEIKNYYKALNFEKLIYKAIPHIFHHYPAEEDLYALFRLEAQLFRRDISSVIEIKNRIRFSETKRQLVRKCEERNITVAENKNLAEYWNLLAEVLLKFESEPVHNLEEITSLQNKFPDHIKLFEAKEGDDLLGGILIFDFGKVIHTQYMAASDAGRKTGALDYINHFLLEKYEDRAYYSFGISTENKGTYLNEGLIQQKENMGARAITLDFYSIKL